MAGKLYGAQQQYLLDLQENRGFGSDPNSWLSNDDLRDTISSLTADAATASATGNVDRTLFNNLVEILPLVQSLIDRKANTSFTKRASMIYTKTPSRDSIHKKAVGRSATLPAKKNTGLGDKGRQNSGTDQNGCSENFSIFTSKIFLEEKEREELTVLRGEVEDLKTQLSEKNELLKLAEASKKEMGAVRVKLEELHNEAAQKDALIKSTQSQLSDAKIKLADKQAAVEKLQWMVTESNQKVGRLQEGLDRLQGDFSDIMSLIEGLTRKDLVSDDNCYDLPYFPDEDDKMDSEMALLKLENAREAYVSALNTAKEKQDEESLASAAAARFYLHSIALAEAE